MAKKKDYVTAAPDYSQWCGFMGGNLKDLPEPHIQRFSSSSPCRRRVTVTITSFVGASIGAKHIYVTLREEQNSFWNAKEKRWERPWDPPFDEDFRGRSFSEEFLLTPGYQDRLTLWVHSIIRRHFPAGRFELVDENWGEFDREHWAYEDELGLSEFVRPENDGGQELPLPGYGKRR